MKKLLLLSLFFVVSGVQAMEEKQLQVLPQADQSKNDLSQISRIITMAPSGYLAARKVKIFLLAHKNRADFINQDTVRFVMKTLCEEWNFNGFTAVHYFTEGGTLNGKFVDRESQEIDNLAQQSPEDYKKLDTLAQQWHEDYKAFIRAAAENRSPEAMTLIKKGVFPLDELLDTATFEATCKHYELQEFLIQAGVDRHRVESAGKLKALKEAIKEAIDDEKLFAIQELIKSGVDVNSPFLRGTLGYSTPLAYAAAQNKAKVVLYLIDRLGANIHATNRRGETALMHAASSFMNGDGEMVRILLKLGARIDQTDNAGRTAIMHMPYFVSTVASMEALAKAHPDLTVRDVEGKNIFDMIKEASPWTAYLNLILQKEAEKKQ